MENRDDIIKRVFAVIDELGDCCDTNIFSNYPISTILDQVGRELLMIAPIAVIDRVKSFKTAPLVAKVDGTGEVELPSDFVRLICFKMRGWHKGVYETISTTSRKYVRQFHRATRGGVAQPVVALCGGRVQYFSVLMDTSHIIEIADYVDYTTVDEYYPKILIDALVWLTAATLLKVMSEYEASKAATEEYERVMNNIFLKYGK